MMGCVYDGEFVCYGMVRGFKGGTSFGESMYIVLNSLEFVFFPV